MRQSNFEVSKLLSMYGRILAHHALLALTDDNQLKELLLPILNKTEPLLPFLCMKKEEAVITLCRNAKELSLMLENRPNPLMPLADRLFENSICSSRGKSFLLAACLLLKVKRFSIAKRTLLQAEKICRKQRTADFQALPVFDAASAKVSHVAKRLEAIVKGENAIPKPVRQSEVFHLLQDYFPWLA